MKFDQISEPIERRLANGLTRLAAAARALEWRAADALALTPTQADLLHYVANRPRARLTDAAAHLGVRKPTASDAVAALERKSLVRRGADAEDGRAVALTLTALGHRLAAKWPVSYEQVVQGLERQDQEKLLEIVVKMISSMQARGLIVPQRTCVSCKYFRKNVMPDTPTPHFCAFVGAPMAVRHLRVDCAEHENAA
jgi:DNA-binding MarR family transcriptional regulator